MDFFSHTPFRLYVMKGTVKVPAVDLLRLGILRDSTFITPKSYHEHLRPFNMEFHPPGV